MAVNLVDFSEIEDLQKDLLTASNTYATELKKVKPQFGAYMLYSIFLEEGTKKMPIGHVRVSIRKRLKRSTKIAFGKPIGPHILPAITNNATFLVRGVGGEVIRLFAQQIKTGRKPQNISGRVAQAWVRFLNDRPRQQAVKNAPFEFGFHMRSIRGWVEAPSSSDVKTMQAKAKSREKKNK